MISRSVAQIATASMRTRTSAFFGTGTGLLAMLSWPGSPSTQARCVSGIGNSLWLVFTPAGAYIFPPIRILCVCANLVSDGVRSFAVLRSRLAEFGRQPASRRRDLIPHERNVFVTCAHCRSRSADCSDHSPGLVADRRTDANDTRQIFFAIDCITVAADDPQRLEQGRQLGDRLVGETLHPAREDALDLVFRQPGHDGLADRRCMRRLD